MRQFRKFKAAPIPRLAPVINATRRIIDYLRLGPRDNEIEHRTPFDGHPPRSEQLTADERDRLVERGPAGAGVTHRGVLVPDRHAAVEDVPVRG